MQNIKFFLVLFMILVFNSTSAQINLDSIRTRLNNSKKWTKTQKIRYLNVYFQRFENTNNKYDVYLDKKGKLLEYLGCSVIYYEYDDLNRLIKRIGYNLKGNFSLWDFSPIETTEYLNDTIQNNFFDFKYKLSDRKVTIKDSMNRTIEVQYFDKNLKCISRKVNEYIDKENQLIIRDYDGIGHPKSDVNGVSIIVQKFDQLNKKFISEERFYDTKMKLIDADHNSIGDIYIVCKYSILRRKMLNKEILVSYYDSKEELQCELNETNLKISKTLQSK